MRWILLLATSLLLPACVNYTQQAKDSVEASVLHYYTISYRNFQTYSGNVICGEFSTRRRPKDDSFLPFIYRATAVDTTPSKEDVAIFCSKDPAMSLYGVYGISLSGEYGEALNRIRDDYRRLGTALTQYESDNFYLPRTSQGLEALLRPSKSAPIPRRFKDGGYMSELPRDPWNTPYIYTGPSFAGVKGYYTILTLGADGIEGGTNENADVTSTQMKYINHIEKK